MNTSRHESLTNYITYRDLQNKRNFIGHYDFSEKTIQPLAFISGTPIDNLYQVIEVGEANILPSGNPFPASSVKILPPLAERDVLCVGKNYAEHAKEFNNSGFDSSDKVDTPSHPVIFTKRFTSVIADGENILSHPGFTQTLDYEGEVGVIIGKSGFRIHEEEAASHVWGYTIINDVTARERQRDHKQFYIGKSADTFCPMGPIAVPASKLDKVLRVQTHINGELRQDATTNDLIFSVPYLIKTMSEGQTLMPGDVLATGTPVGVGIGRKPPTYLQAGDTIAVSVTGLGTLTNSVAGSDSLDSTRTTDPSASHLIQSNITRTADGSSMPLINNKPLNYRTLGKDTSPPIVFVHHCGGSMESFISLILELQLEDLYSINLFDLEGQGLSPTTPLSKLSIGSFTEDVNGVFEYAQITSSATLIAHGMGCLVAIQFALAHPKKVSRLVLIGLPLCPPSDAQVEDLYERARIVREKGIAAVVDSVASGGTSTRTKVMNPLAYVAVRMSLLGQDSEGYAKACTAFAEANSPDFSAIQADTLLITGSEANASPPETCEWYAKTIGSNASLKVLRDVGHWPIFEDVKGVASLIQEFLS